MINDAGTERGMGFDLKPILFLMVIFFCSFMGRIILAPLMPVIEQDLGISHSQAGQFFLLTNLSYSAALFGSGFISSLILHRRTILFAVIGIGVSLLLAGMTGSLPGMYAALLMLGFAAGLYLPSGLATITDLVSQRHWGKAMGIHELAPSLSFILAPILAEVLMKWFSWRAVLMALGFFSLAVGGCFMRYGKGGDFPGQPPGARVAGPILSSSAFWIMLYLFVLSAGNNAGVYSMMPLYLVTEKGLERTFANSIIACAGLLNPFAALGAGWLNDRMGEKTAIFFCLIAGGLVSIMLGVASGSWIAAFVILHPALTAAFFAPGLAALSRVAPPEVRNVTISLTLPISNFVGRGAVAAALGYLGEHYSFAAGIMSMGALVLSGLIFIRYVTFYSGNEETHPQSDCSGRR